jgi:hypothetical protein
MSVSIKSKALKITKRHITNIQHISGDLIEIIVNYLQVPCFEIEPQWPSQYNFWASGWVTLSSGVYSRQDMRFTCSQQRQDWF